MQITFKSFEDWGTDMFAIQDFQGITNDDTNYYMAGAVIFKDDILENIFNFVDMAAQAGSAIIMIDFSNADLWDGDGGEVGGAKDFLDAIVTQMKEWGYRDLQSYENRLAFGLTDESSEYNELKEKYNNLCDRILYEEGWDPREEDE